MNPTIQNPGKYIDEPQPSLPARPPLIGIIGPAGSGKTTLAIKITKVLSRTDKRTRRIRFAGPIKEMVSCLLQNCGMSKKVANRHVDGDLKEREIDSLPADVTARDLMQTLGTEWGRRNVDSDVWLETAMQRVEDATSLGHLALIDDVRFPNEADRIRDMGGVIVRVRRPGHEWDTTHESEASLSEYVPDYLIENSGSMQGLVESTRVLLTDLEYIKRGNDD